MEPLTAVSCTEHYYTGILRRLSKPIIYLLYLIPSALLTNYVGSQNTLYLVYIVALVILLVILGKVFSKESRRRRIRSELANLRLRVNELIDEASTQGFTSIINELHDIGNRLDVLSNNKNSYTSALLDEIAGIKNKLDSIEDKIAEYSARLEEYDNTKVKVIEKIDNILNLIDSMI